MIWPSFVLEGRYDTNLFQEEDSLEPSAVPVIRIMPGVAVSNANPANLAWEVAVAADGRIYATGNETIFSLSNAGVLADAKAVILPNGVFSVSLLESFRRVVSAQNVETSDSYNRNANRIGARFEIKPGGGALKTYFGYDFILNRFDDFDRGDYLSHDVVAGVRWRFYPKTEAFIDGTFSIWDWSRETSADGQRVDHMPLRVQGGLNGYLTKRLTLLAKAGYGNSLHGEGPSYNNVIGHAEVGYAPSASMLFAAGFTRDYQSSFYGNYYVENRTYLRGQFRFLRQFGVDLSAGYHHIQFAEFDPIASDPGAASDGNYTVVSHKERTDHQVSGHVRFDVSFSRWLAMSVGYEARAVFSDFELLNHVDGGVSAPDLDFVDKVAYVRHQVYASLNFQY